MLSVTNRVMHGKLTGQLIRDQSKTRNIPSNLCSISVIERVIGLTNSFKSFVRDSCDFNETASCLAPLPSNKK